MRSNSPCPCPAEAVPGTQTSIERPWRINCQGRSVYCHQEPQTGREKDKTAE